MTVLLAIDPGTRETGWAIFLQKPSPRGPGLSASGPKEHDPAKGGETLSQPARLYWEESAQEHQHWTLAETGLIVAHDRPRRVGAVERIKTIEVELNRVAETWRPLEVAWKKPSLLQLPQQQAVIETLSRTLERWAQGYSMSFYCYPLREIRAAISDRANATKEELVYAVMTRWDLLGKVKTTHEWTAIAIGDYHLGRHRI